MNIVKLISCSVMGLFTALGLAQDPITPPIQPKISPVATPPAFSVPPPKGELVVTGAITAAEAASIALKHQPQIAVARAAIQAAHGNVLMAEQSLLPNGTIGAGYASIYSLPNIGGSTAFRSIGNGYSASVTVTQLVFDFGRELDFIRGQRAVETAQTFNLTTVESDYVFTVKQDFYTYVQNLKAVDVAVANLKDNNDNLALAQAQLNAGTGEPGNVVTAQTNVAATTVTLIQARNTASVSEVALALAMGIDPRTPLVPADSTEKSFPIDDVDKLVDEALKRRPEIKQQQQLIKSAGYNVSYARKSLLPQVNLLGSGSVAPSYQSSTYPRTGSLSLTLSWDPFAVVSERGQVLSAQASVETARQNLISASQTVVSDISTAYLNIKSSEQRIVTANSEVANGTEGLRIAEGQFRSGVTTFVTVTNAETQLAQARIDLVDATAALQLARAAMEHALGRPL